MTHHIIKSIAALFLGAMLLTVSVGCEKDNNNEPANPPQETLDLANTSWVCAMENAIVMQGVPMNIILDGSIDFIDDESGELYQLVTVEVPSYPAANRSMDQSYNFKYMVEGNKILVVDWGEEDFASSDTLIYNPEEQTIVWSQDDADFREIFGTDTIIFTRAQ